MSGISVEVLPDAGAPQVGVTVSGLPAGAPSVVTVERSTDGVTWETVRGAQRETVTGSAFFRDFVPPLNVPCTYRLVTDAALDPAAVYAWAGTANASASTETRDGVVTRTNYSRAPQPNTNASYAWSAGGGTSTAVLVSDATDGPEVAPGVRLTRYIRRTLTSATTSTSGFYHYTISPAPVVAGSTWKAPIYVRSSVATRVRLAVSGRTAAGAAQGGAINGDYVTIPANEWVRVDAPALTATDAADGIGWWAMMPDPLPSGATVEAAGSLVEQTSDLRSYFDGSTSPIPAPTTATITVESDTAWLQDPLNPRTAVAVRYLPAAGGAVLVAGTAAELVASMPADIVQVQGARLPVASLGVRQAPANVPLLFAAIAAAQGALVKSIQQLLEDAGTIVVRGLPASIPLDPSAHVISPDIKTRPSTDGAHSIYEMSVTQVRAPAARLAVPWWTYDQVKALWEGFTYDAVLAARPGATYLDWLRDPTPEGS
ncbi:hypothetical protein [Cellulomonas hominis]|uniref:hypothetical protein n=1 Tax=Cellulomonas hominis TaxID=156981 RepID=UPI0014446012|nr:hypothetical protein [Cellulomonas hominis]NKY08951.1 hypothetical protein [Cellulomonas hominis]